VPTQNFHLPTEPEITVTLVYLCKWSESDGCPGGLMYLQGIRTGSLAAVSPSGRPEDAAESRTYSSLRDRHVARLTVEVSEPVLAVISPPSRHSELTLPYRDAVKKRFPHATDLTDRFKRAENVSAGESASLTDLVNALTYHPGGDEGTFSSLLIIDDVFARGRTAAALVKRLREAGLPENCTITIAAPLWLPREGNRSRPHAMPSDPSTPLPELRTSSSAD
jgi:hypothetical protein